MKRMILSTFLAAACFTLAVDPFCADAAEPKTPSPNKPPKDAPKDPDAADPEAAAEAAARYTFAKDADSEALVDFCLQLQDYEPEDDADADLHDKRAPRAIKRACRRIMELEKDKESDNARFARRMTLAMQLDNATELDSTRSTQLLKRTREFLKSPKVIADDADVASALADFLSAHSGPKSIEWCQKVGNDLAHHAVPEVAATGKVLLGTAKRLGVVGKPMPIKGTTVDGKPFDLTQFKDKVVLIEFWATWCPHCVDELPYLKKCYDAYHSKGFEIVDISSDEELQTLQEFLKLEKLDWIHLHEAGGKHPALQEYGISSYPSNFLLGKDGKVVAIDLRDKALSDQLKLALGAPEAGKEITEDALPKESKAKPKKGAVEKNDDTEESEETLKKKYTF